MLRHGTGYHLANRGTDTRAIQGYLGHKNIQGERTLQKAIKLLRVSDNQAVNAVLTKLGQNHLDDFEAMWKPRLQMATEEDNHWDWIKKNRLTASSLSYEKYAIECDCVNQGMMMLEIDWHRSRSESSKNLVYVDFLATTPWNRPSIQDPPQYRGVGTVMNKSFRAPLVIQGIVPTS